MSERTSTMTVLCAALFVLGLVVGPRTADAAGREVISFRLVKWRSAHFDDANTAQTHHATLTKIGCEANQQQHAGHYDVRFRCPQWRSIALESHSEAHQWEKWLKSHGFETVHEH